MKKNKILTGATVLTAICLPATSSMAQHILGIDVSSAQGTINWTTVHANGVEFAFVKATEGTNILDGSFHNNMINGKAAGVQMGAYHFARPDLDTPATEATYFWNAAGAYILSDGKSIYPAVIFDVFNGHDGTGTYTQWFNQWANDVKAKDSTFLHPVIYVTACTGACDLTTNIQLSAWIANYNGENGYVGNPWGGCDCCNAWDPCGTNNWTYWQFASTGAIGGISGEVDLDIFDGTLAELKSTQGVGGS